MKNNKGITLIALVITIIVLLILAGVAVSTLFGDNGLITKAQDTQKMQNVASFSDRFATESAAALSTFLASDRGDQASTDYARELNNAVNAALAAGKITNPTKKPTFEKVQPSGVRVTGDGKLQFDGKHYGQATVNNDKFNVTFTVYAKPTQ